LGRVPPHFWKPSPMQNPSPPRADDPALCDGPPLRQHHAQPVVRSGKPLLSRRKGSNSKTAGALLPMSSPGGILPKERRSCRWDCGQDGWAVKFFGRVRLGSDIQQSREIPLLYSGVWKNGMLKRGGPWPVWVGSHALYACLVPPQVFVGFAPPWASPRPFWRARCVVVGGPLKKTVFKAGGVGLSSE